MLNIPIAKKKKILDSLNVEEEIVYFVNYRDAIICPKM